MSTVYTAAQTKNNFSESLRLAESGEIVEITRYGRSVAALVSIETLEQLRRLQAAVPTTGLAQLVGRYDDGDDFANILDEVVKERSPFEDPPTLED